MMEPRSTGPAYIPPVARPLSQPIPFPPTEVRVDIGKWISEGWQALKQDWLVFAVATLVASFLSIVTLTITTGPFLLGLYFMAFKAMRGEKVQVGDIFKGFEFFGLAFLAWVIHAFVQVAIYGMANNTPFLAFVPFAFSPFLHALFAFIYPLILDRRVDIASALNEAWKVVISRQWLMFWVLGLVLSLLYVAGLLGCLVGSLITAPLAICASAAAYKDIFGVRSMPSGPISFDDWSQPGT